MKIGWQSAIAISSLSALLFGAIEPEKPRATRILIHQRLTESCELVQSGQLLQYHDYSVVVVDGIPGELYSLELTPSSFIEPANGSARIKSASKVGFVVKANDVSIPSDLPRVVAIATGAECPLVQDAVILAAKQRDSRRASIQAKLYRPDRDDVTRPVPEPSTQKADTHPATNANATPPSGKPKVMHGTVVLAVAIGPDGAVRDTKVVRSLDAWLDVKAMEEVRTWRFQPARKQGLPVAALIDVQVYFNLH